MKAKFVIFSLFFISSQGIADSVLRSGMSKLHDSFAEESAMDQEIKDACGGSPGRTVFPGSDKVNTTVDETKTNMTSESFNIKCENGATPDPKKVAAIKAQWNQEMDNLNQPKDNSSPARSTTGNNGSDPQTDVSENSQTTAEAQEEINEEKKSKEIVEQKNEEQKVVLNKTNICVKAGLKPLEARLNVIRENTAEVVEKEPNSSVAKHFSAAEACVNEDGENCKDVAAFNKVTFPVENPKKEEKFLRLGCEHTVTLEEFHLPKLRNIRDFYQKGLQVEDAGLEGIGSLDDLLGLTEAFLEKTPGVKKDGEDLQRCQDMQVEKLYEKFKSALAEKTGGYRRARTAKSCIKGKNALFTHKGIHDFTNQEDAENWSFFENFKGEGPEQIGNLNPDRLCEDHARNVCFPVLSFYHLCKSDLNINQATCLKDAEDSIRACVTGNYDEAKVPRSLLDENVENPLIGIYPPQASGESEDEVASGNTSEKLVNLKELIKKDRELSDSELERTFNFSSFFHETYSTCVILREASRAMALKEGNDQISAGDTVPSVNGRYRCFRQVPWTVDFDYCSMNIQWGDGVFDVANAAAKQGIQVKQAMNESEIQRDLAKDAANGDQGAYIEANKKRLNRGAENDYLEASVSGLHAGFLGGMAYNYPAPEMLNGACSGENADSLYGSRDLNCGMLWVLSNHIKADEVMFTENGQTGHKNMQDMMFSNQKIRAAFLNKAAMKMADSVFKAFLGKQKGKQADDLDAIKKQYDEFFGQPAITPQYAGVNYCAQNPTAPSCRGSSRTSGAKLETGFESSGFQGQGGGNFSFNKIQDGFETEEKLTEAERKARERLGDIIGNGGGNEFGDDIAPPGAAKGKYGKAGAGGGGGGGAGAGGGGGGGKAPGPKKDNGKKTAQGMTKGKVNYQAGSGGINWKPGNSSRSKKKDRNAFQSMFGNKQNRNVATVLEGVSPASSKLFEKISKAYNKVKEEKKIYDFSKENE